MQRQKINSFVIVFFLVFTVFLPATYAQTKPSFEIKVIPENYKPEEQVTITVSSFNIPLDSATIEWEVDGEIVKSGPGVKQVKTTAPFSGEEKEVRVVVTQKNTVTEKTITLRPETIELYIESLDGYTPAWYQGRSQIAEESVVKVIAVPDSFNAIGADTVRIYSWSKDNFKDASQSGRGRQAFVTKLSPFVNSEDISVEVGETSEVVTLVPQKTNLSIYEYSPLVGTRFEKELTGNLSLTKEDVTFEAIPWFFSAANRNSSAISMSWTVNGLPTRVQGNRSLLNLRKGTTQKGRAEVGVTVKHKERTLQSERATLNIDL